MLFRQMNLKISEIYGYKSRMTSVHVLTAVDQNFVLNGKGETFILENVKGRKFMEKKK